MEVSRTAPLDRRPGRPRAAAPLRPWRRWTHALFLGATLTSGCQSTGLMSWQRPPKESPQVALERILAEEKANQAQTKTVSQTSPPSVGAAAIAQHMRDGEAALAQHAQNPAQLNVARAHFEEVLRADPNHAIAHHRLAVVADLTHDFASAERHYGQALRLNPRDPQLLHDVGYSYMLQGRHAEAIPYLQQSLALAPGFDMAARKLADAAIQTRQPDLARQALRQVLPEADADRELARLQQSHDPSPKPSFFGRMRQNLEDLRPEKQQRPDPTQELLSELEQARQEGERARQQRELGWQPNSQYAGASRGTGPTAVPPDFLRGQAGIPDSHLAGAIAQIDREGRGTAGHPLVIDPKTGQALPQVNQGYAPSPNSPAGLPQVAAAGQMPVGYGAPAGAAAGSNFVPAPMTSGRPGAGQILQPYAAPPMGAPMAGGQVPFMAAGTPSRPEPEAGAIPAGYASPVYPVQGGVVTAAGYSADPTGAAVSAGMSQPSPVAAGGSFQPAEMYTGPRRLPQSHGVTTAAFGATTPPGGVRQAMLTPGPAAAPGGQTGLIADAAPQSAAANEDYTAAAALGMGLGPGQMFPVVRQTERHSPGSGSLNHGGLYEQAPRQLPTDRPFADLSQAYADLSQAHRVPSGGETAQAPIMPITNSLGQQVPTTAPQWGQPHPLAAGGAPAAWANAQPPATGATGQLPANPLATYEQMRGQYDTQNNAAIQQTYGQYPSASMETPSYGLPVYRPAAPSAQMVGGAEGPATPGAGRVLPAAGLIPGVTTPEPYPSSPLGVRAAAPAASSAPAPQMAPQTISPGLPPPQYDPNVVIPQPYRGGAYGGTFDSYRYPTGTSGGGGYPGPMIVPGQ